MESSVLLWKVSLEVNRTPRVIIGVSKSDILLHRSLSCDLGGEFIGIVVIPPIAVSLLLGWVGVRIILLTSSFA